MNSSRGSWEVGKWHKKTELGNGKAVEKRLRCFEEGNFLKM